MMESTLTFTKRKISDAGSAVYRKLVYPFVKMGIERKCDSIVGKGAYLYKGSVLEGKDFMGTGPSLQTFASGIPPT